MSDSQNNYLDQFVEMARQSSLGESIKSAQLEYDQLPSGMAVFVKCVVDKYSLFDLSNETDKLQDLFCQLIILAYHEASKSDKIVADALANSFVKDFPGVPESCLQLQITTLSTAAIGFKEVAFMDNQIVLWIITKELVLTYNEFLNSLLGFIIPCLRCGKGESPQLEVFAQSYNSKLEQLNSLTGGDDGPFYLICRIARPKIRNAISHSSIWFNSESATVHYVEGTKKKARYSIKLIELLALAQAGSFLPESYLVGISAIAVFKDGTEYAKSLLPEHLYKVYKNGVLSIPPVN